MWSVRPLDVDKILWYLAAENILFADDESLRNERQNDYYVYFEPETD
jgi:spore coat protein CotH